MAFSLRHLILGLLLGGSLASLTAQPSPLAPPIRATVVRFYYYPTADPASGLREPSLKALLDNNKNREAIEVSPRSFSEAFTYYGEGPLVLYKEAKSDKGMVRKVVATVPLPPAQKGVLYILTYTAEGFQFLPIPYSSDGVPAKHVKVINLCPEPLAIKVAGSPALVPARGESILDGSEATLVLPIKVARQVGAEWQVLIETAVPGIKNEERLLYLFVPDSPAFHTVLMVQLGAMPAPPLPLPAGVSR